MAGFSFRKAVRENVGLIIGLAGGTGSGKTFSAMEIASGIAGTRPFAVIDTEAGRALHYADQFVFDHGDLKAPFRPSAYLEAIKAADAAGYPVIVVDSMSHEHAGDGGILDMHEEEFARMGARDAVKMTAWIKPKMEHKRMMQGLLQLRAHLILCFRAEEKVDIQKDAAGKTVIVPKVTRTGLDGWVPVCEKTLPFELTASFLLTADKPGFPKPIKLEQQHRALFPLDKPLTRDSGREVASWAAGRDWAKAIADTKTPAELVEVWKAMPAGAKKTHEAAKEARKVALAAPAPAAMGEVDMLLGKANDAADAETVEAVRGMLAAATPRLTPTAVALVNEALAKADRRVHQA